ncbi:MAG: polysaccharide deacetylase family protein [Phycisphaerae bacterium]
MSAGPIILLYHRVIDLASDPQWLCVSPGHFAEHLDVLRGTCRPTSLTGLLRGLDDGTWADRTVAVTFDDGYADNIEHARPLLGQYDVPATVFATTSDDGNRREFWWDALEGMLLGPETLPDHLELGIESRRREWQLGVQAEENCGRPATRWNVLYTGGDSPRQALYRELCDVLRALPFDRQVEVLNGLAEWVGKPGGVRQTHRRLTPDEILRLSEHERVDIGAHTITHPVLSSLPPAAQQVEIAGGKRRLERILGRSVTAFSYPFGTRSDYTDATIRLVQTAGFACACANAPGVVGPASDRFLWPRFLVRDWDGDAFAQRLEGWFDG